MERPKIQVIYTNELARKCGLTYSTLGSRAVDLITTEDLWLTDDNSCWLAECMSLDELRDYMGTIEMSCGSTLRCMVEGGKLAYDLYPANCVQVPAGIKLKLPEGYGAVILPRSGFGTWLGVSLPNTIGLVDTDYHQDVMIGLRLNGTLPLGANTVSYAVPSKFAPIIGSIGGAPECVIIPKGTRIAQMMIMPIPQADFIEVGDFDEYGTREGGFGSTGLN